MTPTESAGTGPDPSISADVPDTEGRLREAYAAIFSRSFVRVLPYYVWAAALYAFIVFLSLLSPRRLFTVGNFETLGLIVLLACFSLIWLPGWRARLDQRSRLLAGIPSAWRFTRTRVTCSVGAHSSFDADWGALYGAEKLPHGLLVLTHRVVAHWIPRSAFANDGDFDQVAEWAAFGAPRYRQRRTWKVAEWLAALLIAPSAAGLTLHFAMLLQSGQSLLDSYPTLATVLAVSMPHCYAVSWLLGVPMYWLLARFTRHPGFFVLAGAALGAFQTLGFMQNIIPLQPGLAPWIAAFCVGALVHWLIVVRESRA